jgi:CelD/BcsL family acetyltransferase involved in cellulose biosynthesis
MTILVTENTVAAPVRPKNLVCEVFSSFEDLADRQIEWDAFVADAGGDLYYSYDWCRVWWIHYGFDRALHILVFREGGELVGLVPMFVDRAAIGPVRLRMAKLVGSEYAMTVGNPPIRADHAEQIYLRVLEHFIHRRRCDVVRFGPLGGPPDSLDALCRTCAGRPDLGRVVRDAVLGSYTRFDLPDTFDRYLASLDKRQRTNYRRDLHLLARTFQMDTDVIADPDAADTEFLRFKAMHDGQWRAEGKLGHFGDWPRAEAFNRRMVRAQADRGRLRLVRIVADGKVVSCQLCYRFGDTYYWRLPARAVGESWNRHGLGRIGLVKMIGAAIAEGAWTIEAGMGHYDYKLRLGGREYPVRSVLVAANRRTSRARAAVFCRLADLLGLLYYRIWFNRLAPRLPLGRRALWRVWIRSRV